MEVVLSSSIGFCAGVAQVIKLANECLEAGMQERLPVYSIGSFIHNPRVMASFASRGLQEIHLPVHAVPGIALIRAHGITDHLRCGFLEAGFRLVDGTCRNVQYSQQIIRTVDVNDHVVVAGIAGHSEVVALSGLYNSLGTFVPVEVVGSVSDVASLQWESGRIIFMTQTTMPANSYQAILHAMKERFSGRLEIGNHLCPGAIRRNRSVEELCFAVDALVVVGGKGSANTTALADMGREHGLAVWHIESAEEIEQNMFEFDRIGLTAGTSTPREDIEAVKNALERGI